MVELGIIQARIEDIIFDSENAKLHEKSCITDRLTIMNREFKDALSGKNKKVKMFQCPFKNRDGSNQKNYYAAQGINCQYLFFIFDRGTGKKLIGGFWSTNDQIL